MDSVYEEPSLTRHVKVRLGAVSPYLAGSALSMLESGARADTRPSSVCTWVVSASAWTGFSRRQVLPVPGRSRTRLLPPPSRSKWTGWNWLQGTSDLAPGVVTGCCRAGYADPPRAARAASTTSP